MQKSMRLVRWIREQLAAVGDVRRVLVPAVTILAGVAAAGTSQATLIVGQFSGTVTYPGGPFAGPAGSAFTGSYSYDDAAASVGPGPGSFLEGTLYPALSFEIDGTPVTATPGVVIIDGDPGVGADGFYVVKIDAVTGAYPAFGLNTDGTLWSGEALSNMNGRVFSDFVSGLVASSPGPGNLPRGSITSWTQTPEPGTAILLMLGLAGLASQRRRSAGARD